MPARDVRLLPIASSRLVERARWSSHCIAGRLNIEIHLAQGTGDEGPHMVKEKIIWECHDDFAFTQFETVAVCDACVTESEQ